MQQMFKNTIKHERIGIDVSHGHLLGWMIFFLPFKLKQ
jgi:hypothetical protein